MLVDFGKAFLQDSLSNPSLERALYRKRLNRAWDWEDSWQAWNQFQERE